MVIAYAKVKNTTYEHYSGIGSFGKLTLDCTVLDEVCFAGIRQELRFPAVCYELAIWDVLAAIEGRWGILRDTLKRLAAFHEVFAKEDRTYIYTIL